MAGVDKDALAALQAPEDDGPRPMYWKEYSARVRLGLDEVLASDGKERAAQTYLTQHPVLVPGALVGFAGHAPFLHGVITQPPLQGVGRRTPDFVWLAGNSALLQPVMIEIEDSAKRWFSGPVEHPAGERPADSGAVVAPRVARTPQGGPLFNRR